MPKQPNSTIDKNPISRAPREKLWRFWEILRQLEIERASMAVPATGQPLTEVGQSYVAPYNLP